MKQFLKRSVSLVLTLAMTLGLLVGFLPLTASASDASWSRTSVYWPYTSTSYDKYRYTVGLYVKDPVTQEVQNITSHSMYDEGDTDFGSEISDYLLDNNLEKATFGFKWRYYNTWNSGNAGDSEPGSFREFSVKDFYGLWREESETFTQYVGTVYEEYMDMFESDWFEDFLEAGYKVDISYEAKIDGKTYTGTGTPDNVPTYELAVGSEHIGKTLTVKVNVTYRNPSGKVIDTVTRTNTVNFERKIVNSLEIKAEHPVAGERPSYEVTHKNDVRLLTELDPEAFAGVSNGVRWYDVDESRYLDPNGDELFHAGHTYKLYVYMTVKNPEAEFKMNGYNYDFGKDYGVNNSRDGVVIASHTGLGDGKKYVQIIKTFEPLPDRIIEYIPYSMWHFKYWAGHPAPYDPYVSRPYLATFTPPSYSTYCKNGVTWYDKTERRYLKTDGTELIVPGHEYEVNVYIQALGGVKFLMENGEIAVRDGDSGRAVVHSVTGYDKETYLRVTWQVSSEDSKQGMYKYNVNLSFNEPVPGMCPDYNVEVTISSIEVAKDADGTPKIEWYDETGKLLAPTDTFQAGTGYKMRVFLNSLNGCLFCFPEEGSKDSTYFIVNKVEHKNATVKRVYPDRDDMIEVWLEWEELEEKTVLQLKTNVPVPGLDAASYKPALTEKPNYVTVKSASWRNADGSAVTGPLRKGETYLARFTVSIRGATADMIIGANGQPVAYTLHPVDRVYTFDVPLVCQGGNPTGTKVVYTKDSFGRVGATLAVDLEATVELSDIAMEYYLDGGEFTYQWYVGSREIEGATEQSFELTQEHVGWGIYAIVSFADGEWSIIGDRFKVRGLPKKENEITGLEAAIEIPVVGHDLPATAAVTRNGGAAMKDVTVKFYSSNTGSNNSAEWSECVADHKAEAGKYYSAVITVNVSDDDFFNPNVTGTVNGIAHDNRFEKASYVNMDQAVLRIVWSPCDISGHDYEDRVCSRCGAKEPRAIRLAGSHRWDTAIKVADEMKENLGVEKFSAIIVASGNDFADALAGSYLSTVKNAPILLSWGKGGAFEFLDTDNIDYIKNNLAPGGTVYILGGMNAVPAIYEEALKSFTVKRLGGADRFETNLLILEEAGVEDGDEILVCTATNFADSLSASATGKPILLVFNAYGKLLGGQPDFLAGLKNCTFTVIGGESAVSAKLANSVKAYGNVTRLAGANRFETSVMVAEKYFEDPAAAVLAYAWNYPDGLCGGSLAYSMKAPLILTMTKFEATAVAYATGESIKSGIVLGGDGLISDAAVRAIFAMEAADQILLKQ